MLDGCGLRVFDGSGQGLSVKVAGGGGGGSGFVLSFCFRVGVRE